MSSRLTTEQLRARFAYQGSSRLRQLAEERRPEPALAAKSPQPAAPAKEADAGDAWTYEVWRVGGGGDRLLLFSCGDIALASRVGSALALILRPAFDVEMRGRLSKQGEGLRREPTHTVHQGRQVASGAR